jgi:hypothetical protein
MAASYLSLALLSFASSASATAAPTHAPTHAPTNAPTNADDDDDDDDSSSGATSWSLGDDVLTGSLIFIFMLLVIYATGWCWRVKQNKKAHREAMDAAYQAVETAPPERTEASRLLGESMSVST